MRKSLTKSILLTLLSLMGVIFIFLLLFPGFWWVSSYFNGLPIELAVFFAIGFQGMNLRILLKEPRVRNVMENQQSRNNLKLFLLGIPPIYATFIVSIGISGALFNLISLAIFLPLIWIPIEKQLIDSKFWFISPMAWIFLAEVLITRTTGSGLQVTHRDLPKFVALMTPASLCP